MSLGSARNVRLYHSNRRLSMGVTTGRALNSPPPSARLAIYS